MMRIVVGIPLIMIAVGVQAQSPGFLWANPAGGPSNDRGAAVVVDADGNACVAGTVAYETVFGDTTVTAGFADSFVAKYAPDGDLIWVRLGGGPDLDRGHSIGADGFGNLYSTGFFRGSASFGVHTVVSAGRNDIFVVKYDADGEVVWARRAGGIGDDSGLGIAVSAAGDRVAVTGYFENSADFSGTPLTTSSESDIFVAVYDGSGALAWARQAGAADDYDDRGVDVALTDAGDVVVTGVFEESATFGTTQLIGFDSEESFVARYTLSGDLDWVAQISGDGDETVSGVAIDGLDHIFVAGGFGNTLTIGDSTRFNPEANADVFLARFSAGGTLDWVRQVGGRLRGRASSVAADLDDHIIISGDFQGDLEFDDVVLTHHGGSDIFIAVYDAAGRYRWARQAGGAGSPRSFGTAVNQAGEVFVTGDFIDTTHFDGFTISQVNLEDVFVAKLETVTGTGVEGPRPSASGGQLSVYPDPFEQQTSISFRLPRPQRHVTLSMYDVLGRRVWKWNKGYQGEGAYSVDFDGHGLASGVYFCRLETEEFAYTRPMIRSK
ncbi:MAG: T9SS type A sorting domain-containing protein [Rhodothermales bacterium]|nr:T9SS type A sorting domain-containing protein [Rhodothermales bacterium]